MKKLILLILRDKGTRRFIAGLALLTLLAGLYFWRQSRPPSPTTTVTSPFEKLSYQSVNLKGKKLSISSPSSRLPRKATVYRQEHILPPLLAESGGITKLKQTLNIKDTDRTIAPAESIFWYGNDRYLSLNQNTNVLSFTLNIRAQEHLPQQGACPSERQAISYVDQFLQNNKLISNQSPEFSASLEELSVVGLLPADKSACQAIKVTYYPIMNGYRLIYSQNQPFIRIIRMDNLYQIIGFYLHNASYQELVSEATLKTFQEIKKALQNNQGVYLKSCKQQDNSSTISLSSPQFVYFVNEKDNSIQPVFTLTGTTSNTCTTVILVRGLKENWYQ